MINEAVASIRQPASPAKEGLPIRTSAAFSAGAHRALAVDTETVNERRQLLRRAVAVLLKRAILTLAAQPDREHGWLNSQRSSMPEPVREAVESFGWQAARAARFTPSPVDIDRYLDVLDWLSWLGRQNDGKRNVQIITARAFGAPLWKLGQRFGKSEETVRRWENDALDDVARAFTMQIMSMAD
ncbi:MAG TPA: DUF6362 family protein [Kaistia sp.]|nr:DUF6362 family protein [Kaistia sp.]